MIVDFGRFLTPQASAITDPTRYIADICTETLSVIEGAIS